MPTAIHRRNVGSGSSDFAERRHRQRDIWESTRAPAKDSRYANETSAAQLPPPERNMPGLAQQAMHKDKFARSPTNCPDAQLADAAVIIQEGHVRREARRRPAPSPALVIATPRAR